VHLNPVWSSLRRGRSLKVSQRAHLTYTEIAPFLGLTERATDRIVFTNSNELAEDVKNRDAMRTVRGTDFDNLTEDDFRAISCWLREQPVAIPKLSPRDPDQIEALKYQETGYASAWRDDGGTEADGGAGEGWQRSSLKAPGD
jgi:hypothetical protein